jgi:hypothetical protein
MVTLRERDNVRQRQIKDPIAELSCSRVSIATCLEGSDDDYSNGDLVFCR